MPESWFLNKMEKIEEIRTIYEELKTVQISKKRECLFRRKNFLQLEKYICLLQNGKTIVREKILKNHKEGNAAIILPITENGEYILAIEPRVFTKDTVDIGFPAGYIEEDENPCKAAIRELEEETGYQPESLEFVGSYYPDQGCSGACNYYYIARNCKKVGDQHLDEGEFIKYVLVTEEELEKIVSLGMIKGLNSAYLLERVKNRKEKR